MKGIMFQKGKDPHRSMGVGVANFIEIERIFVKVLYINNEPLDQKMMPVETGHRFFQKVVDQRIIDWDLVVETFPHLEMELKAQLCKVKFTFLGSKNGLGAHPTYLRLQIAGKTIHYNGKFYDLPERKKVDRA